MLAARTLDAIRWRAQGGVTSRESRAVPEEVAIGLSYDSAPHLVVIGTPADVEDLAVGFTVTEGVASAADIERITVSRHPEGFEADILLTADGSRSLALARKRTLEARSSCGLCGVQAIREAVRAPRPVSGVATLTRSAIQRALAELEAGQTLGRLTRATHAAAWCDLSGAVRHVREDVGRHNALDKAVGAAARAGLDPAEAMILVTSRCSYEMVDKAAAAGIPILVAISAPTALAIDQARRAGLTLVALARGDGHTVFAGGQRIVEG